MGVIGQAAGNKTILVDREWDRTEEGGGKAEQRQMTFFIMLVWE